MRLVYSLLFSKSKSVCSSRAPRVGELICSRERRPVRGRGSTLEVERLSVARTELALAELDALIAPANKQVVLPARGYLSRTAGCYKADGSSGPPPSAMTLALNNFWRELKLSLIHI